MAVREFSLDNGQKIKIIKSKLSKHLRISIDSTGQVRVSIPNWMPYRQGLIFAKQRQDWIDKHTPSETLLISGNRIGKSHRLFFEQVNRAKPVSRVANNQIIIKLPLDIDVKDDTAQIFARKACIRALKIESKALLPIRLETLAKKHGFVYNSLDIKHLKGRWGSCSSHQNITLNCLLMQLTWKEIDYVIVHELVHTKNMSHNVKFWNEVRSIISDTDDIKKQIKTRRPILLPG